MTTVSIAGFAALLAWIDLLLFRAGFWKMRKAVIPPSVDAGGASANPESRRICVVIPARNEADCVAGSIRSLLSFADLETKGGEKPGLEMHIIVVDDNSTDGTAGATGAAMPERRPANRTRVEVISGEPLPPGWSGKVWALHQGIERALESNPDLLLLTDADIMHAPGDLTGLIRQAESGNYDLASLMVRLHCESVPEKLMIPAFLFFFFMLYPPAWIANLRHRAAGAAGGCMLIRPGALARAGGVEAIRGQLIDDCALARTVKQTGGRVWLGLADGSRSIRSYGSLAQIARMISRSAYHQLHHSIGLLVATVAGLTIIFLAPLALLLSFDVRQAVLGLTAVLLMALAFVPTIRYCRLHLWWTLTLPAAALIYAGATIHSAVQFWRNRGGEWKGRAQDKSSN